MSVFKSSRISFFQESAMSTISSVLPKQRPLALRRGADSQFLAGMLMAAVLAALLVVADQLIDTWSDGHLLASWVALWLVAFAGLATLANPLRAVARVIALTKARWARAEAQRRVEAQLWECAQGDHRAMADVMQAWQRSA
jgi:hypothetical protein